MATEREVRLRLNLTNPDALEKVIKTTQGEREVKFKIDLDLTPDQISSKMDAVAESLSTQLQRSIIRSAGQNDVGLAKEGLKTLVSRILSTETLEAIANGQAKAYGEFLQKSLDKSAKQASQNIGSTNIDKAIDDTLRAMEEGAKKIEAQQRKLEEAAIRSFNATSGKVKEDSFEKSNKQIDAAIAKTYKQIEAEEKLAAVESARRRVEDTALAKAVAQNEAGFKNTGTVAQAVAFAKQQEFLENLPSVKLGDEIRKGSQNLNSAKELSDFLDRERIAQDSAAQLFKTFDAKKNAGLDKFTGAGDLAKFNAVANQITDFGGGTPLETIVSQIEKFKKQQEILNPKKQSFFDAERLNNVDSLTQLGFAGLTGGIPGLIGGALGGASPLGEGGILLGSTAASIAVGTLESAFERIKNALEVAAEAGISFEKSILGITAVLQETRTVTTAGGTPLPFAAQIGIQQEQARAIQLEARSRLLPLGIAGQTEGTFVQGITSSLAQRGFDFNAEQVGKISELLGGAIVAQRPSLLESPTLLLRDLNDTLSGGSLANKTILSQIIRPSIGGITTAGSTEEIVKALEALKAFPAVATGLDNPIITLNRLKGAIDNLQTTTGTAFLDAVTPALATLGRTLQTPEVTNGLSRLAETIGNLAAKAITTTAGIADAIAKLGQAAGPATPGLLLAGLGGASSLGAGAALKAFEKKSEKDAFQEALIGGAEQNAGGALFSKLSGLAKFNILPNILGEGAGLFPTFARFLPALGGPAGLALGALGAAAGGIAINELTKPSEEAQDVAFNEKLAALRATGVSSSTNTDTKLKGISARFGFEKDLQKVSSDKGDSTITKLRGVDQYLSTIDAAGKSEFNSDAADALGLKSALQAKDLQDRLNTIDTSTLTGQQEAAQATIASSTEQISTIARQIDKNNAQIEELRDPKKIAELNDPNRLEELKKRTKAADDEADKKRADLEAKANFEARLNKIPGFTTSEENLGAKKALRDFDLQDKTRRNKAREELIQAERAPIQNDEAIKSLQDQNEVANLRQLELENKGKAATARQSQIIGLQKQALGFDTESIGGRLAQANFAAQQSIVKLAPDIGEDRARELAAGTFARTTVATSVDAAQGVIAFNTTANALADELSRNAISLQDLDRSTAALSRKLKVAADGTSFFGDKREALGDRGEEIRDSQLKTSRTKKNFAEDRELRALERRAAVLDAQAQVDADNFGKLNSLQKSYNESLQKQLEGLNKERSLTTAKRDLAAAQKASEKGSDTAEGQEDIQFNLRKAELTVRLLENQLPEEDSSSLTAQQLDVKKKIDLQRLRIAERSEKELPEDDRLGLRALERQARSEGRSLRQNGRDIKDVDDEEASVGSQIAKNAIEADALERRNKLIPVEQASNVLNTFQKFAGTPFGNSLKSGAVQALTQIQDFNKETGVAGVNTPELSQDPSKLIDSIQKSAEQTAKQQSDLLAGMLKIFGDGDKNGGLAKKQSDDVTSIKGQMDKLGDTISQALKNF